MYFYQTQIMRSVGITGSLSVQEDIQVSVGGPGGTWKGVRTPRRDLLFSEAHRNGGCEKALFFSGFLFFLHASGAQAFQAFQSQLVLCMCPSFSCGYHHACLTVPSCVFPSAWAAIQPVGQRRKGIIHTHTETLAQHNPVFLGRLHHGATPGSHFLLWYRTVSPGEFLAVWESFRSVEPFFIWITAIQKSCSFTCQGAWIWAVACLLGKYLHCSVSCPSFLLPSLCRLLCFWVRDCVSAGSGLDSMGRKRHYRA